MFDKLERYFNSLKRSGPTWGYYPDTNKSIMIVHPDNIEAGGLFGQFHGFKVCTGSHYFGSYIGDDKSKVN